MASGSTGAAQPIPYRPKAQRQSTLSSFLDLPKELRLEIYEHLFPARAGTLVVISEDKTHSLGWRRHPSNRIQKLRYEFVPPVAFSPNILRADKQIYDEAVPFFYKNVTFCLASCSGSLLTSFLALQSASAKSYIRRIRLRPPCLPIDYVCRFNWTITCAQVARMCDTLQEVHVDVSLAPSPCETGLQQLESLCWKPLSTIPDHLLKLVSWNAQWSERDIQVATRIFYHRVSVEREMAARKKAAETMRRAAEEKARLAAETVSESEVTLVDEDDVLSMIKKDKEDIDDDKISLDEAKGTELSRATARTRCPKFLKKLTYTRFLSYAGSFFRSLACSKEELDGSDKTSVTDDNIHLCPCMDNAPGYCNALVATLPKQTRFEYIAIR